MTKRQIKARVEDLIHVVYGRKFDRNKDGYIAHMGDMRQFAELVNLADSTFGTTAIVGSWGTITMPWNLDKWVTPDTVAALVKRHLVEVPKP